MLVNYRHAHRLIGEFARRGQTREAPTDDNDVRERHHFGVTRGGIGGYRHTRHSIKRRAGLTSSEAPA
jgi:hypothetical protein